MALDEVEEFLCDAQDARRLIAGGKPAVALVPEVGCLGEDGDDGDAVACDNKGTSPYNLLGQVVPDVIV